MIPENNEPLELRLKNIEAQLELATGVIQHIEFLKKIHVGLEAIVEGLKFDLRKMIEFGDDYNQSVKDNIENLEKVLKCLAHLVK